MQLVSSNRLTEVRSLLPSHGQSTKKEDQSHCRNKHSSTFVLLNKGHKYPFLTKEGVIFLCISICGEIHYVTDESTRVANYLVLGSVLQHPKCWD